jgi:hypothetical protein
MEHKKCSIPEHCAFLEPRTQETGQHHAKRKCPAPLDESARDQVFKPIGTGSLTG